MVRCRKCEGCRREDCRECENCLDMKKYGGKGIKKRACLYKVCVLDDYYWQAQTAAFEGDSVVADRAPEPKTEGNLEQPESLPVAAEEEEEEEVQNVEEKEEDVKYPKRHQFNPYQLAPKPTNIRTTQKKIYPNLSHEHTSWSLAVNPQNALPLTAAQSFKARTEPRPPPKPKKVAVPASSATRSKLQQLKLLSLQAESPRTRSNATPKMVSDEGEDESEIQTRMDVSTSENDSTSEDVDEYLDDEGDEDLNDEDEDDDDDDDDEEEEEAEDSSSGAESVEQGARRYNSGNWTEEESLLFLYGLKHYGGEGACFAKIGRLVQTRSMIQIKSHNQNVEGREKKYAIDFDILRKNRGLVRKLVAQAKRRMMEEGDVVDRDLELDSIFDESSSHDESDYNDEDMDAASSRGDADEEEYGNDRHDQESLQLSAIPSGACIPGHVATDEEISNFLKCTEMIKDYKRLSDRNRFVVDSLEFVRTKTTKRTSGQLEIRCRKCARSGQKMPAFSHSMPGRIEVAMTNIGLISAKHLLGCPTKTLELCSFIPDQKRATIRASRKKSRCQTVKRGGLSLSAYIDKVMAVCGIVNAVDGIRLKSEVGDYVRKTPVKGKKALKKASSSRRIVSPSPRRRAAKRRHSDASSSVSVDRVPSTFSSRAFRRTALKAKSAYEGGGQGHKLRKKLKEKKTILPMAMKIVANALDTCVSNALDNPDEALADPNTPSVDLDNIFSFTPQVKEIPPPRLTEETKNAVDSSNYKCPDCNFPLEPHTIHFFPYADLVHLEQKNPLCTGCNSYFVAATESYIKQREQKLVDPWSPQIFPIPIVRIGGVSEEFMSHFMSLKVRLTASKARMKDFGRIPATGGQGKFQYMVGDKSESEKRWQWQDCRLLQNAPLETKAIERFALNHVAAQLPLGKDGYRIDPGFVMTHTATVQAPHRDYQGYEHLYRNQREQEYDKAETQFLPWVLHCPLCTEGMELNYWPESRKSQPPVRIHIPFGTFLVLRVDAVHGGIFGSPGNIRLHVAFTPLAEAIQEKGLELQKSGQENDTVSDATIQYHMELGATEAGQHQRKLDLLREDLFDYRDPKGVDDCERSFPVAYEEPGYAQRLLKRNSAVWEPSMIDNISPDHFYAGK